VARVVDHASAANKARAENGIPPLVQDLPIGDDIATVVGFVGHHDNDRVPAYVTESACNSAPETMFPGILDWSAFRDPGVDLLQ
jgi:hypothetical protein